MKPAIDLDDLITLVTDESAQDTSLEQLTRAVILAEQLAVVSDQLVGHFVDIARRDGASWADIGTALGVSKQAVQKRFVARRVPGDSRALFTKFNDEARAVPVDAMELARAGGQADVNTGHIVLALLADPKSTAACILESQGVALARVRESIHTHMAPVEGAVPDHLPFGPDAKKALELSLREAFRHKADVIGPEHILLGVLRDTTSLGGKTLAEHGADRRKISDSID
jgi:hypothetical protein